MEDEGNHGNDETRLFILSSLAQHHKSRISCVLCEDSMLVFDRYPLVDGTFFLSPKRHTPDCIEVNGNSTIVACAPIYIIYCNKYHWHFHPIRLSMKAKRST